MIRLILLNFTIGILTLQSNAFSSPDSFAKSRSTRDGHTMTRLHYAALEDPMSRADSTKSGCPFLIQKYEFRTFDVPVLFGSDTRPIVLYDANSPANLLLMSKILKYGNLRFASLQSTVGDLLLRRMSDEVRNEVVNIDENEVDDGREKYKSIAVCDAKRTFVKSSAMLEIMRLLTSTENNGRDAKYSKRFKLLQFLALLSYTVPNRVRDRFYDFFTNRKRLFGSEQKSIAVKDDRYVDDALLKGSGENTNLFESASPPTRGSQIKIVYPSSSASSPSITFDDEFPNGLCLVGGIGTISTVDLPMRVVLRVDRKSLGLEDGEGIIAWVKPEEIAKI